MTEERGESGRSEPIEKSVADLYRKRFPESLRQRRMKVWKILCESWFSKYIPDSARVLEIGAGYCEFSNNIRAQRRVAVDLNPEIAQHAQEGVETFVIPADDIAETFDSGTFDAVFMSNFLEHCRSRDQIVAILRASREVLADGGCVIILGPNFRHCFKSYFDYLDHHLALTDFAIAEALALAGFDLEVQKAQTLPYSFKSRLPSWPWIVRLYIQWPWAWPLFGAQYFLVGRKQG